MMSQSRIKSIEPPYTDEIQESFNVVMPQGMPPLNLFRAVGNNERVLSRMVRGGLLDKGSISIAQRELVILRACAMCGAEYEWGVHVAGFAKKAGFSEDQIAGTCSKSIDVSIWSEEQQMLLQLVDELHVSSHLEDETWRELSKIFAGEQLIELIMLAGLYHAVSFVVNGLNIENETFAPKFPRRTNTDNCAKHY